MKRTKTEKVALYGILGALALALSAAEGFLVPALPFLPPGAKPGLSNIVTMFAASCVGPAATIYVVLIKAAFAFITRGLTAFLMSLAGGILSALTMLVLNRFRDKSISLVGMGVCAASMHNIGQLLVSFFLTRTAAIAGYAPFLLLFGVVTGFVTGSILNAVIPAVEKIMKDRKNK